MPVRINAPPPHCSNDRRSPRMSQDVTAANSGSKQKISAARAVDISRWTRICSRRQMVLANSTVYRSAPAKRGVQWMCGRSNSAVARPATTAVAAIWKNTRRRGSYRRVSSATATIWPPKQTAHTSVSTSPRFKPPASGAVSRYIPSVARASAAAVSQRGRSPSRASAITGASTDDTATMNAERDGVVITSPAVCAMNPTATSAPSTATPESSRPAGRGRNRVPGASASAAMPKRTVRNANGVASASALLTATKLVPHSAVASSSARSACRRVIAPSGRSRDVPEIASRGRVGVASDVLRGSLRDDAPARVAGTRSHFDHPVGPLDDVEMVLDHEHRVAGVDEAVEHAAQRPDVVEVQAGRRLVEEGELAPRAGFPARERQLAGDLQALRLAARERGRRLAEPQVAQPDLLQVPQGAGQPRLAVKRSEEHTSELQSPCNLVC